VLNDRKSFNKKKNVPYRVTENALCSFAEWKFWGHPVGDTVLQRNCEWKTATNKALTLEEFQLVRCLTHISHRYLRRGRTLVISSPSTYRDVQLELMAEIHRTAIWPAVVTVDGNINKPNETNFIDRDASYIIWIPDGNINRFRAEFIGLAKGRSKFRRIWDSEARFVVAGANEYSKSH